MIDTCIDCGTELRLVFPDFDPEESKQYDNALEITFYGGYGMFIDILDREEPKIFLCHDCAHHACEALPWLNKLLVPERSHAHTAEYWATNRDHVGWDHPDRQN